MVDIGWKYREFPWPQFRLVASAEHADSTVYHVDHFLIGVVVVSRGRPGRDFGSKHPNGRGGDQMGLESFPDAGFHLVEIVERHLRFHERLLGEALVRERQDDYG